jgi:hypothetical protein
MTPPRHGFGAHYCSASLFGQMDKLVQRFLKFLRLHVVGESAEAGISPTSIDRVTTRMPQTAKFSHVPVTNPSFSERARQPAAVELRIVSRARDRSNIN